MAQRQYENHKLVHNLRTVTVYQALNNKYLCIDLSKRIENFRKKDTLTIIVTVQ